MIIMAVSKKDLIKKIAGVTEKSQKDVSEIVEATLDAITAELVAGETVNFIGFGKFEVTHREARVGRNPATGEILELGASKSPKFKASKKLKDIVNGE
jgi:DNA-binding protein HU-beta